jgi:3-oxoacyl-(acyl-carrier-protein) synthase
MAASQSKNSLSTNTLNTRPPLYIRQSHILNAAGESVDEIWAVLDRKHSQIDRYADVGLVARLRSIALQQITAMKAEPHLKEYDPATLLGVLVARRLFPFISRSETCATIIGSSRGNTQSLEGEMERFTTGQPLSVSGSPATTMGSFAAAVARDAALGGMQMSVSSACSTSMQAMIVGAAMIRAGLADEALVGGAECATTPFTVALLKRLRIYHRSDENTYLPFSGERFGMVVGEGAAMHLVTTRAAQANAEILGVGSASERATMTGLSPQGHALVVACRRALGDAQMDPQAVGGIYAHGAGTRIGDAAELNAYRSVFGAALPPLLFDKWCFGHTLGAASATSVALAIEWSRRGKGYVVPGIQSFAHEISPGSAVLVAALGFGGGAAAVLLRAV